MERGAMEMWGTDVWSRVEIGIDRYIGKDRGRRGVQSNRDAEVLP
jgi:hypothetical protein